MATNRSTNGSTHGSVHGSPTPSHALTSSGDPPRCEPDPLDPDVICLAKVIADDRQGISHFFGRNKKVTHTIPNGVFPLLCRTHYQEKQYRWNDDQGALSAFQCDCILKSLERMAEMSWTDEDGIEWPRWCGFELQTQKEPDPEKARSGKHCIPQWLQKLCSKEEARHDFISVGERAGARYSFQQLAKIVRSIKSWCMENSVRLPSVEALPITIGLVNEAEIEDAKIGLRTATREYNLANHQLTRAERMGGQVNALNEAVERAQEGMEMAEEALEIARQDGETTKSTVRARQYKKKAHKDETPDTEIVASVEVEEPLKRKRSESVKSSRKKIQVGPERNSIPVD